MASFNFNPPVIAHRGASAYAPENTLIAFTKAAQFGIQWVEFDVTQASSGEPIIFHDDLLDRTTNAKGEITHYTYAYLQTLDAGAWFSPEFSGERIPTLKQVLDFLCDTKMSANVEIKEIKKQQESLVIRILKEIEHYPELMKSSILFSSFSVEALHYLRKHAPNCRMGFLLHEWEPHWQEICTSLQCVSVNVNHEIMTREAAQKIKNMGKTLLCYTVNDPARASQLYSFGVDAVFSDAPDKISENIKICQT